MYYLLLRGDCFLWTGAGAGAGAKSGAGTGAGEEKEGVSKMKP